MIKPDSLRQALVAAIPSLGTEPGALTVLVEQGSIATTGTLTPSFEYRYTAHVLATNFSGDTDPVFVAVVEWVRKNQPDLVTNPAARASITFEVGVRDPATADLSIRLALTESVNVATGPDGRHVITHVDDTLVDPANTLTWVALPQIR